MEVSILGVWDEGWIMWPREVLGTSLALPSSLCREGRISRELVHVENSVYSSTCQASREPTLHRMRTLKMKILQLYEVRRLVEYS